MKIVAALPDTRLRNVVMLCFCSLQNSIKAASPVAEQEALSLSMRGNAVGELKWLCKRVVWTCKLKLGQVSSEYCEPALTSWKRSGSISLDLLGVELRLLKAQS